MNRRPLCHFYWYYIIRTLHQSYNCNPFILQHPCRFYFSSDSDWLHFRLLFYPFVYRRRTEYSCPTLLLLHSLSISYGFIPFMQLYNWSEHRILCIINTITICTSSLMTDATFNQVRGLIKMPGSRTYQIGWSQNFSFDWTTRQFSSES